MYTWKVSLHKKNKTVIVKSKTYIGACFKAFKKMKVKTPEFNYFTERFMNTICHKINDHLPSK